MKKINNTFMFEPKVNGDFEIDLELVPSKVRGSIHITDGEVTNGQEIIDHIARNSSETFLVNKTVFNHMVKNGYMNVCMWDNEKTEHGYETYQGGVIFA
jgi:hypothetical protein